MSSDIKKFTKILLRRDTSSNFSSKILASGEPVYATDTGALKIGDGQTAYSGLPVVGGAGGGGGLTEVVEDLSPELGASLNLNSFNLIGTGNISISGDMTGTNALFDKLSLDTSADPTIGSGTIGWISSEGTTAVGLEDGTNIYIGEHSFFRLRNNTANTLYAGQAVYADGIHNNSLIESQLYVADGSVREVKFMGLVLSNILINQKGYAINFGYIDNVDTRGNGSVNGATYLYSSDEPAWSEGDILYVHPTVPGKLTKVEPRHSISVAIVMYVHRNNGKIFVRPTSYGHLNDNHDVSLSGVSHNDVLVYDSGTSYWKNNNTVVFSDTSSASGSSKVSNVIQISQNDYDSLGSYDPNTIYFIT